MIVLAHTVIETIQAQLLLISFTEGRASDHAELNFPHPNLFQIIESVEDEFSDKGFSSTSQDVFFYLNI